MKTSDLLVVLFLFLVLLFRIIYKLVRGRAHEPSKFATLKTLMQTKRDEKQEERITRANTIVNSAANEFVGTIVIPDDIELRETANCLMILGTVQGIGKICDEFAAMEQLPNGFCLLFGPWRLFVLDDDPVSDRELKLFSMPHDHWLFMSCKLRDSITGYDVHPYIYWYEPFTFKKVLTFGIGVNASDLVNDNDIESDN